MSKEQWVYSSKNAFSAGELTPTIEGRNDLPIYQHGVKKLINWMILPSGGITRRHGTEYVHIFQGKQPLPKCMMNIMHSREWSFLVILTRLEKNKTKVEALINGKGKAINLGIIGIDLDINQFSYTAYQGIAYISFGIKYPVWRFLIDPSKIIEFDLLNANELNEEQSRQLFIFEEFKVKGKIYNTELNQSKFYSGLKSVDKENLNKALEDANSKGKDLKILYSNSLNIFEGRLWAFGNRANIHEIWASSLGSMDEFNLAYKSLMEARNPMSAFSAVFTSSTFDNVIWSLPFAKELLLATTDGIYVLKTGDRTKDEFININKDIDMSISVVPPVICGKTIFFVEGDNKKIHSLYYSQERGGYQVSCITTYAEHLFSSGIKQIVAVNSPFNMIFAILNNGSFATFTYSQDLKIMGWSQHWLGGDGKVVEAISLYGDDSDKVYFRVRRDGKIHDRKTAEFNVIHREYIESFDCKYLTGSSQLCKIHDPLYADCYSHYKRDGEDEIDQEFDRALKGINAFEFKDDLSNLEYLILQQAKLESVFREDDVLNSFVVGESALNRLEDIEEIDNSNPDIPEDERSIITINLKALYVDFIKKYFEEYSSKVKMALGLQVAIIRKLQTFNGYVTNILLGHYDDMRYLESIITESEYILKEYRKFIIELQAIEIDEHIQAKSNWFIEHKENSKYKFCLIGLLDIRKQDSLAGTIAFIQGMRRTFVMLQYYSSSREFFIKHYKEKLLKDLNFKSNYQLLKLNSSINVESLDISEYGV
tara:strand:- start:36 stop:2333 length:2298 start_codon:yes stop_codon:yes gene_type:complete